MSAHRCHALGCGAPCPPKHLMCGTCWAEVPPEMQAEVYRTVTLRNQSRIDATWAPWWRAQATAIAHVAFHKEPDTGKRDAYLARSMRTAAVMEGKW